MGDNMRTILAVPLIFSAAAFAHSAHTAEAAASETFQEMKTASSCGGKCDITFKKSKKNRVIRYISCHSAVYDIYDTNPAIIKISKGNAVKAEMFFGTTYVADPYVLYIIDGFVPLAKNQQVVVTLYGTKGATCTINGETL